MRKVIPFWSKSKKKRSLQLEEADPRRYIGKTIIAHKELHDEEPEEVTIKTILGSMPHPKYFEVNGTHFVHTLSFYEQVLNNRLPSKEEIDEFELATEIKTIKEVPDGSA